MNVDGARRFFRYARERQQIFMRRAAGEPRERWTNDPILQKYRFCCVFREDDKTTRWFRQHVRDPLQKKPEVLLATVVFRLFNRISTGEAVFCQRDIEYDSAFHQFLKIKEAFCMQKVIIDFCGRGPYVTGAYIISSPAGYSKLDGILKILSNFMKNSEWEKVASSMFSTSGGSWTLQQAHAWFSRQPYLGNFHAYEIVTDLRHTHLLKNASDVDTWASVGPGARRGLNRIAGRDKRDKSLRTDDMLAEMIALLQKSRLKTYWPHENLWEPWEMREVEHTLCEFDKYERVRLGEGTPRGRYP